jgi:capsular polysaccharide export protein
MMSSGARRSFLFLQGLATPFFVRLGREIAARGHAVHRINLCGGDRVFWPRPGAVDYRGRFADWRAFLGAFIHDHAVTDIVLFGDCRPYHRVASDLGRSRGIEVHVFEEGYFRPDWITLERGGTNGYSTLPRDPQAVIEGEAGCAGAEQSVAAVGGGFSRRISWEILNQISTMLLSPLYPNYRRHRSCHPLLEFGGWIRRYAKRAYEQRYAARVSAHLADAQRRYFLLPLQLETDYQIRRHSPIKTMSALLDLVLESFAASAPPDAVIVAKVHPLDNGLVNYRRHAERIARKLGLAGRVFVIDGGHLPTLLSRSQGVVVVNSTTGLSALGHSRPLKALGRAMFDMPGLTFQGSLDDFWNAAPPPDHDLFRAFRRVVLERAQINGSFFTNGGLRLAIEGAIAHMGVAAVATQGVATAVGPTTERPPAAKSPVMMSP